MHLNIIAIGIGAFLGAILRYLLSIYLATPYGTLAANIIGGFLAGILLGYFQQHTEIPGWIKLFSTSGFLGGLTTFSTFSVEAIGLINNEQFLQASLYIATSLIFTLSFTWIGLLITK